MLEPVVAPAPAPAAPAPAAAAPAPAPAPASPPFAAAPAQAFNEKGYWPDNWQARLAGDDEKALKQLGRYGSPEDIWKKARSTLVLALRQLGDLPELALGQVRLPQG